MTDSDRLFILKKRADGLKTDCESTILDAYPSRRREQLKRLLYALDKFVNYDDSEAADNGNETHKRFYLTARVIGTLLDYLEEREGGAAAT